MAAVAEAMADGFRPSKRYTVSEWADEHRKLSSKSSKEHGPWRTSRTPYLQRIMDALSPQSPIQKIVFAKGSQIGATEVLINWIGYVIAHCPGPMLVLQPTKPVSEQFVRFRVDPMVDASADVRAKVPGKNDKDGGNSLHLKDVPGGAIYFRGSNSAADVAGVPVRYLAGDEVDRYPLDVQGEGSVTDLGTRRTATFSDDRKLYFCSTPTIEGESAIWQMFEETAQEYYFVPCPHCGALQRIVWARIKWEGDGDPYLECEANGCVIEERHKTTMLRDGEWRETEPDKSDPLVLGLHLSAFYSPLGWYSWRQARDDFRSAVRAMKVDKDPAKLKTWTNTVEGGCWKEKGEAPPWERLYSRREGYARNVVPAGGLVMTGAVDVQHDRLELELRAWGPRWESWSIDHRVFPGPTSSLDGPRSPWPALAAVLSESWPHELGGRLGLARLAVDSSDQTQTVYAWCRNRPLVMPIKGSAKSAVLLGTPKAVDVREDGRVISRGVTLWSVGVSLAKSEFYGWIGQERPEAGELAPTGWVHWPEYEEEYFKQLTAEVLITRHVKGYKRTEWTKVRERNEALDLAVYNRAAAALIGVDRFSPERWAGIRAELTRTAESDPAHVTTARKQRKRRKSEYW